MCQLSPDAVLIILMFSVNDSKARATGRKGTIGVATARKIGAIFSLNQVQGVVNAGVEGKG